MASNSTHPNSLVEQELIPEIVYPKMLKESLSEIVDKLIDAIKKDGMPHDKVGLKIGKLQAKQNLAQFYFFWITETNEVIENINLVLRDFHILGKKMYMFEGDPKKRLYLLVRVYFYEFYRIREIFNDAVKGFELGGFIKKEEIKPIRNKFHEAFEHTINLRNILVHQSANWHGKEHAKLSFISTVEKLGFDLTEKEAGERVSLQNALNNICAKFYKALFEDGKRMSEILQNIINMWSELMIKNLTTRCI